MQNLFNIQDGTSWLNTMIVLDELAIRRRISELTYFWNNINDSGIC